MDDGDGDEEEVVRKPAAAPHFRFFDLPLELRLRVYEYRLIVPKTIDLDPTNSRSLVPLLRLLLVSHRMHEETYRVFYGSNTFRVFPVHSRFFHTKAPLLARLSPQYRAVITKLEIRLGPGWTKPPRCWMVDGKLGLGDMEKLRLLKIFVEHDPASHPSFEGYGMGDRWYTEFCVGIVKSLVAEMPTVTKVEFDGYPGISQGSPLMQALLDEVKAHDLQITWGPERGWHTIEAIKVATVQTMMQKLGLDRRHKKSP
ncbi:hypothetical protein K504DRAFT_468399 [Pleomassaria siparia CBS 279.74]|uniref:F-box domain-containing protein n=1 Tax=Pleomassaria siparia CBS 279.74 TaxID=1314801 RepID=A0A6G1K6K4_9PLEO|nr:hypothetical protein K504DRAFT_468399 [Pleomassaria siparia CBS 279.74]